MAIGGAAGAWRGGCHDLIERLVVAHHAELAAGALLERGQTDLEIGDFGEQLPVALALLGVGAGLRLDRLAAGARPRAFPDPRPTAGTAARPGITPRMTAKILMGTEA